MKDIRRNAMKITNDNINLIKDRLEYLYTNFSIEPSIEEIEIDDEEIFIGFPDEWDGETSSYSIDDFLKYTDKLEDIKVIGRHSVVLGNIRQTILSVDKYYYEQLVPNLNFETEKFSLKIVNNPLLIGIIASRDGIYNENFGVYPCSDYTAVEIILKNSEKFDELYIEEFIKKCLYYISSKYNVPISIGEFLTWDDITDKDNDDSLIISDSELIPYCKAMDYYVNSLSIEAPDIKYLHLYKIIEYFSPSVSKKTSYEHLNKRLDALQVIDRDSEYIESIFTLTKQYEVSLKDKELANTVLQECIDIISIFDLLPKTLQKNISKNCQFEIKSISSLNSAKIDLINKEIASILYATRNSVVHAKSNYTITGKECLEEDLEQLNIFITSLCKCLFVWNGRQNKEYRLK